MLKYLLGTDSGIRAKRWVPAKELSLKRWNGSPPRLRASSICWSRLISVCPVPVCFPISSCRPPPGMKRRYEYLGYASVYPPLSAAVDPARESKSDWEITKASLAPFLKCVGHLGQETDVVLHPLQHDSRRNWRSHLIFSTGVKASANLFRAKPPQYRRG